MRCPGCGRALGEEAHFCQHCGRPVGQGEGPAEPSNRDSARERKVVTLLFADIVGFTSMGEARDPELVSSLVAATFARLAREVRRYEGTIEKFAGDAMLAVFGVPTAHEDDPERAVRAALEMQTAMAAMRASADDGQPALELHIGIESGEVLVDRARALDERDLFVTGDAVNTAARLEAAAEPGSIVVGATTRDATRAVVDYETLPALGLKGKARPVAAWRVVAVKPPGEDRRSLDLESPLVGREGELGRLEDAVDRVAGDDHSHLVTVLGDAGVGKSRLVRELERHLDSLPQAYHWRAGRCVAFADRSFGPISDVVKADAGISDDDGPGAARQKLARRLEGLRLGDEERLRDALEAVLGVGDQDGLQRAELFEAWQRYFATIARDAPLVLVVEDIHWADDDVLAFIEFLARWGEGPVAVVCLARHELLERRSAWGSGMPGATTIVLEPLDEAASASLVGSLLEGGLPADLRQHVVERSEGNPLFAEETVRMLVDRGLLSYDDGSWQLTRSLAEIEIPQSIQAILAARLDTLSAGEKRVAQDAGVVGRIFWDTLVAHLGGVDPDVTEERLRRLRAKDLIVVREPSSLADATELGFRHVLIRDVAYESLPKRDRADIHERIATWVEERLADRIDEFAELVASHLVAALGYEQAFAARGSAELRQTREHTYEAAQRAARHASSLGLVQRACRWTRMAIELARTLERSPREIAGLADEDAANHGIRMNYGMTDLPDHVAMLSRAVVDLEAVGELTEADEQLVARLRSAWGSVHLVARDFEAGAAVVLDGIARLEAGEATPGRARLHHTLGSYHSRGGLDPGATTALEIALAEATACGDAEVERWALHDLGGSYGFGASNLDGGIELIEQSYRLALDAGDRALMWRCRHNLSELRQWRGDPLAAIVELSQEGLRQERFDTERDWHLGSAFALASYLWQMGRLDEALTVSDQAIRAGTIHGGYPGNPFNLRALIRRSRGELTAAEREEAARDDADGEPGDWELWYDLVERAWAAWSRDSATAPAQLEADLERGDLHHSIRAELVNILVRMMLRLGDQAQLEHAVSLYEGLERSGLLPLEEASHSVEGIAAANAGGLEKSAVELEEKDYYLAALDLWMDAALLAARAGRETDALDRARAIIERTGLHPLIGPIPETRWLDA